MPKCPAMPLIKSYTLYADGRVTVSKAPVQCGYELDYVSMCRHSILEFIWEPSHARVSGHATDQIRYIHTLYTQMGM